MTATAEDNAHKTVSVEDTNSQEYNRFQDGFRKLDSMNVASMDYRQMAAMIESMKKLVQTAKRNVINKLSRKIKQFKVKKTSSDTDKHSAKIQRHIDEIAMIKSIDASRISKFALANEDTVANLSKKGTVTPHLLTLTRLAEDKSLSSFVHKWRVEHEDWRVLANFMLSKNTSRHFKRSEQKSKVTKDNLLVEKELLHKRLGTQEGVSLDGDVNEPLMERTSKTNKYKKKGKKRIENTHDAEESTHESSDDDDTDEGKATKAIGDDLDADLFTFNIVEEDFDLIKNEGQEVVVSQEDRSLAVDSQTKSLASKLFSAPASNNNIDYKDKDAEPVSESNINKKEDDASDCTDNTTAIVTSVTHPTRSSEKSKLKSKKLSKVNKLSSITTAKEAENIKAKNSAPKKEEKLSTVKEGSEVMTQAVISQSDGEMVKAVLNLDQLTQRNTESLQLDDKPSKDTPNQQSSRRKKSAFFLGGSNEIDESLGTNQAEQDRARKNQKVSGYKGLRDREKRLLTSTFTESLKSSWPKRKPKKHDEETAKNSQTNKKNAFQSKKYAAGHENTSTNSDRTSKLKGRTEDRQSETLAVESLHPSWQASKKRKEQLELMKKGPQGKKIKFDDDD